MAAKKDQPRESEEQARAVAMQIRLDPLLHHQVKEVTDRAGISINQFVQGVLRWAVENAEPGEPFVPPGGKFVSRNPIPGCVFFGRRGSYEWDRETEEPTNRIADFGEIIFALDFSGRGLVRQRHSPGPVPDNDGIRCWPNSPAAASER